MLPENPKIGFIGFGEVSYHFSKGMKEQGIREIRAYDKNAGKEESGNVIQARALEADVILVSTLEDLIYESELVVSAVWGNVSLEVVQQAAECLSPGQVFADINNTNPSVKKAGSDFIHAAGADYVDVALFDTPVQKGIQSFMLVSGNGATEFETVLNRYGMNIKVVEGEAGDATTIKTLANIYYKGKTLHLDD